MRLTVAPIALYGCLPLHFVSKYINRYITSISTSLYRHTSFHPRMCMVNPNSRKGYQSTRILTTVLAARPTSRPSAQNHPLIARQLVPITRSQSSHKTTLPRHPRHCPVPNSGHRSGESRVCPDPSRPGPSRIHAIDVNAEPPTAFHAYFYHSPNTINEKLVYDANSIDDKSSKDGSKSVSQHLYLPFPVTSYKTYKSTKPNGCVARARPVLIVALVILCMYYHYPIALSWPYIIYARYNISHSG